MSDSKTVVTTESQAPPLILRVVYFFLFGWWFTGVWINVAWILNVSIIGLPLGLLMLNRVPQVLTLKPIPSVLEATVQDGKVVYVKIDGVPQRSWIIRLIYFIFVGWWLSLIWSNVAWVLCAVIIGLPPGIWMLNRLPAVTTLMKS
jgi:uncharacterized membrane protein YccF (DUF307 family)